MTEAATGTDIPPPGKARLITSRDDKQTYSANRETDTRGALTRGVAEILEQLSAQAQGGRVMRFKKVRDDYAEPEQTAVYPSAVVRTIGAGTYDASSFTPEISKDSRIPGPDGRYVVKLAELKQDLALEIWATDKKERAELVSALESYLNPVDFMYGFRLELPFYFNARATFELTSVVYEDDEETAMRRYRRALFTVAATVPLLKLATFPLARPLFKLQDVGPDVDVVVNLTVS